MTLFFNLLLYLAAGCSFAYLVKVWEDLGKNQFYRFFRFVAFIGSVYCFFMIYLIMINTVSLLFIEDLKNIGMSSSVIFWFLFLTLFVLPMFLGVKTVRILTASAKPKNNKKNKGNFIA